MYIHDVSTWEVEAGGSEVQDHPQRHREFKAILDYIIPHILKDKEKKQKERED